MKKRERGRQSMCMNVFVCMCFCDLVYEKKVACYSYCIFSFKRFDLVNG